LEESFNRYLPLNTTFQTATPQQISNINDLSENKTATLTDRVAVSKSTKYNNFNAVADVAVQNEAMDGTPASPAAKAAKDRYLASFGKNLPPAEAEDLAKARREGALAAKIAATGKMPNGDPAICGDM